MLSAFASQTQSRRGDHHRGVSDEERRACLPFDVLSPQELAELKARVLAAQAKKVSGAEDPATPVGGTVN